MRYVSSVPLEPIVDCGDLLDWQRRHYKTVSLRSAWLNSLGSLAAPLGAHHFTRIPIGFKQCNLPVMSVTWFSTTQLPHVIYTPSIVDLKSLCPQNYKGNSKQQTGLARIVLRSLICMLALFVKFFGLVIRNVLVPILYGHRIYCPAFLHTKAGRRTFE